MASAGRKPSNLHLIESEPGFNALTEEHSGKLVV